MSPHRESGQVLIAVSVMVGVLIGLVGLVVDAGFLASQRRQAQNASDAAALAAARALFEHQTNEQAIATGVEYAEANGFATDDGDSITVHIPPTSGPHSGDLNFAEAVVEGDSSTYFIHILIPGSPGVAARAVAGIAQFPEDYALVALNPTACRSFDQTGSASLTVVGGGVMVNSSCASNAMEKSGSGNLIVDGSIDIHGGYSSAGNSGTVSPDPNALVPWTIEDPLAGIQTPSLGSPAAGSPGTAASPSTWKITSGGEYNLQPGTYYGGLDINCSNCTINLAPGVYTIAGGGFSKAGNPTIVGEGVTIYVTDCNGPDVTSNCSGDGAAAGVKLAGGGDLNLSPPSDGLYQGITFWQDKLVTDEFSINGDNSSVQGIFYAPGATLDLGGGADLGVVQLVADKIEVSGNAPLDLEYGEFRIFEAPDVVLVE
jgi:hypothetical protein